MALKEVSQGVQQTTPFSCGAASCLFLMRMLGVEKPAGQTVGNVMKKTSTWGPVPIVGSSPHNIASYLQHRCKGRTDGLTIRRMGGSSPISRAWIHLLAPAISGFGKFNGTLGANDAVLRFVVPESFHVTAHFVVQTHFGKAGCRIMDPDDGSNAAMTFADYLYENNCQETGLDLVISG